MTEQGYEDAVLRNSQRIFLIALSFFSNQSDAEDATQNVLLKLWKHREKLNDPTHIDKWLTRVTVNECRSLLRLRRQTISYEEIEALCAVPAAQEEQELMLAVLRLPKEQRVAVHLYYYEEFSVREIARLLHISENAVKKRLSRARETLRNRLKEEPCNETE
ncbi:MAG: RNA polymerase sigma factor [Oscillospiraceae bacterium]|nr:RNA polymerase sigma factor [Oscillospiraceae bacterium]